MIMNNLEKKIREKILEKKKEMLNYILMRCYAYSWGLEKYLKNYDEEDCYKWSEEKVSKVFNIAQEVLWLKDENENANWEIWYVAGFIDWINEDV